MSNFNYGLIIIGGGGAGITVAAMAKGLGIKTLMVDKGRFGGGCTWWGPVPGKALNQSARVYSLLSDIHTYGIKMSPKSRFSSDDVMKSVREIIENIYKNESGDFFEKLGIHSSEDSHVKFIDNHTVEINGVDVTSEKFFIATGSSPILPSIPGIESVDYLTNETVFKLIKIPSSLTVIGGGVVGVELASSFSSLGVKITLLEMKNSVLPEEDQELVEILKNKFKSRGMDIIPGADIISIKSGKGVVVNYKVNGIEGVVKSDYILFAAGRKPDLHGLDLENAGVEYDDIGVKVNRYFQTSAKNIYAAGDVVGLYQLAHIASYQAIIASSNMLLPVKRKANYNYIPQCIFSEPEFARSGMTEKDAIKKYGDKISVFKNYYSNLDRARADRKDCGMAKVICNKKGLILGIHVIGERAGEIMHELHLARAMKIPLYKINSVIHAYPGYSDIVISLAREAYIDHLQNYALVRLLRFFKR